MDDAEERRDAGRAGDDPLALLLSTFAGSPEPPSLPEVLGPDTAAAVPDLDTPLPEPDLPGAPAAPPSLSDFPVEASDPGVPEPAVAFDEPPLPGAGQLSEPEWADDAPTDCVPAAPASTTALELPSFDALIDLPGVDWPGLAPDVLEPPLDSATAEPGPEGPAPVEPPAPAKPPTLLEAEFPEFAAAELEAPPEEPPPVATAEPDEPPIGESSASRAPTLPDLEAALAPVAPSGLLRSRVPTPDALPGPAAEEPPSGEQHLVFRLAGAEYAAPLADVLEIGHLPRVTPAPHVPPWVLGVSSVRGDIVSVVDLRGFLGLPGVRDLPGRFVLTRGGPGGVTAGLVVDGVREIFRLSPERVAPLAGDGGQAIEDALCPYLRGLTRHAGRFLRVLDLGRLLNSAAMRQFEPI